MGANSGPLENAGVLQEGSRGLGAKVCVLGTDHGLVVISRILWATDYCSGGYN